MKKKAEVKKQIVPALQCGAFWTYKSYKPQDLAVVQTFLTNFDKQLKPILVEPNLEDNYRILCEKIGYDIHPSLASGKTAPPANTPNILQELGDKYIMITNHKIDLTTARLLAYVSPLVKLNTIKLSNNNLTGEQLKLLQSMIVKDENASVVMFEWNPILDVELSKSVFSSFVKTNLITLVFRSNKMGNDVFKQLASKIAEAQELKLKYLDVYDNDLTAQSLPTIANLLLTNRTIEHLELSKNQLESESTLIQIFDSIGIFPISQEELQSHRVLEKQRDELIEKNKKRKKGTPEDPVPFVPKIEQINQKWYYVRNNKLKSLNLLWNSIGSVSFGCIKDFIKRINPIASEQPFLLNLSGNEFSAKEKETLKTKHGIKL